MMTKRCSKCGRDLPVGSFHKDNHRKDGLRSWCKVCCSQSYKNRKMKDPERIRAQGRKADQKWRRAHLERARARVRAWQKQQDPERLAKKHRAWMLKWAKSMDFYRLVTQSFNKRFYKMLISPLAWLHLKLGNKERYIRHVAISVGHSTLDRLHLIKAPTLVIMGTEDKLLPLHSAEVMAERIPNAKLVKFEGGSHTLMYEMRGRFNKEVLDFLRAS